MITESAVIYPESLVSKYLNTLHNFSSLLKLIWLHSAERILNDYLNMLCRWQKQYAPKSPNEPLHPNFVESLTNMDYYNYLYELVRYGDEADKRSLYTTEKKKINELEKRMKQQTVAKPAVKRKAI